MKETSRLTAFLEGTAQVLMFPVYLVVIFVIFMLAMIELFRRG